MIKIETYVKLQPMTVAVLTLLVNMISTLFPQASNRTQYCSLIFCRQEQYEEYFSIGFLWSLSHKYKYSLKNCFIVDNVFTIYLDYMLFNCKEMTCLAPSSFFYQILSAFNMLKIMSDDFIPPPPTPILKGNQKFSFCDNFGIISKQNEILLVMLIKVHHAICMIRQSL